MPITRRPRLSDAEKQQRRQEEQQRWQEQLDILEQGARAWNQWRREHPEIHPSLSGSALNAVNLTDADLSRATLVGASFSQTGFLRGRSFRDVSDIDLSGADFSGIDFIGTTFKGVALTGVNLTDATVGFTNFGDIDLSSVKGLDTVEHEGPSIISIDTIIRSQGRIPEIFFRKAGVPDSFIKAIPSLVGSLRPVEFYSCFISYSSKDQEFAEQLYADLQSKGVHCWFAPEDIKIGDKFRSRIEEGILRSEKLLLVLSEHSIKSTWVEKEVETAFEKERKRKKLVLFPVRLDDAVTSTRQGWAADLRRIRHIGDFRNWKNEGEYQKAFTRLLRDLKAET